MTSPVELYTTAGCEHSEAAREDLEWRGVGFEEYEVDKHRKAYERMVALTGGNGTVPVIAEEVKLARIGWRGRGCVEERRSE